MNKLIFILALFSLLMLTGAYALELSINDGQSTIVLPSISAIDFERGYVLFPQAVKLTVESTQEWTVYVRSDDLNMGTFGKPASDLLWKISTNKVFFKALDVDQLFFSGSAGSYTVYMDLKLILSWEKDHPGNYYFNLIYSYPQL